MIYPDFSHRDAASLAEGIKAAIEQQRSAVRPIMAIAPEQATFVNTVLALEESGRELDLLTSLFFNLLHCDADNEAMRLSEELTPLLSDLGNEISMSVELARNVEQVYERGMAELSPAEQRLTHRSYESYKDGGAFLPDEVRSQLMALRKELSMLTLKFGQNNLVEENNYSLHITDATLLSRLPDSAMETARAKAVEQGVEGWLFDFSFPSYTALLRYCDSQEVREEIYRARQMMCADETKETCNRSILSRIVAVREEIARLLGHPTYAAYRLKDRMAKSPERVYAMLDDLYDAYIETARQEVQTVSAFAAHAPIHPLRGEMMPWDWSYYVEQYKAAHLQYDEQEVRAYFALESVVKAMFGLATDLYGIVFTPNHTLSKYHEEVLVYDVIDEQGAPVGTLLTDYHPRKGKSSGAWMTNYVEAYGDVRPVVSIVMNFSRPTQESPALLTFNEVTTLFHEFGHALHGLLTRVPFASLSGTNVVRDFVELPSQLMENWMRRRDYVQEWARHYRTGEPIPSHLLDAIERNNLFLEGYACIRQLSFGYLDMAWHTGVVHSVGKDIETVEAAVLEKTRLLPQPAEGTISCAFSHIFSGGYAAGYYGYKWAEILDADAFAEFELHGLRDRTTADRFRALLEQGDLIDADELYRQFKGRDATVDALKRRSGITC